MTCFSPIQGYVPNPKLKGVGIVFGRKHSKGEPLLVSCGQCIGCRIDRARAWGIRCTHEAQMSGPSCFITLTFDNDNLDPDGSLNKEDYQLFMKRLRKHYDVPIRYFHCGEYGEKLFRPHHHAILFGVDFPDKRCFRVSKGVSYYVSSTLSKLWPFGYHIIGAATLRSYMYVARYCLKKVTGDAADRHYRGLLPEYISMSLRPGLGYSFYQRFRSDIYNYDHIVFDDTHKYRVPRYYDKLLLRDDPSLYESIKAKRVKVAKENQILDPYARAVDLFQKETALLYRLSKLRRSYEEIAP